MSDKGGDPVMRPESPRRRSLSPSPSPPGGSRLRRSRDRDSSRRRRRSRSDSRSPPRDRSYSPPRRRRSRSHSRSRSRSRSPGWKRSRGYRGDEGYRAYDRGGRGPHPRGGYPPDAGYRGGHGDWRGPPDPYYNGPPPPPFGPHGHPPDDYGPPGPPPGPYGYGPPREVRRDRRGRPRDEGPPGVSLLIRNVTGDITTQDLQHAFGRIGEIRDVYIPRDFHSQQPKGFAFIEYATPAMAREARNEMDRFIIKGREIEVVFAQERRKTPNEMRGRVMGDAGRDDRGRPGDRERSRDRDRGGRSFERSSSFERHKMQERERQVRPNDSRPRGEGRSGEARNSTGMRQQAKEAPSER